MPKRTIKQIAIAECCDADSEFVSRVVVALCSDDTVWTLNARAKEPVWRELPPVPETRADPEA